MSRRPRRNIAGRTNAVGWAYARRHSAREILLTSIDPRYSPGFEPPDSRGERRVNPVIASGGAGIYGHFADVFTRGRADAALAASVFHFRHHSVPSLKQWLSTRGIPMRLTGDRC
jgi:cyclase